MKLPRRAKASMKSLRSLLSRPGILGLVIAIMSSLAMASGLLWQQYQSELSDLEQRMMFERIQAEETYISCYMVLLNDPGKFPAVGGGVAWTIYGWPMSREYLAEVYNHCNARKTFTLQSSEQRFIATNENLEWKIEVFKWIFFTAITLNMLGAIGFSISRRLRKDGEA